MGISIQTCMRPWTFVALSAPVSAATAVSMVYPIGHASFSDGMPLGISGTSNFMLVFQAEHNILMHPFHILGVMGVSVGLSSLICMVLLYLHLFFPKQKVMHLSTQVIMLRPVLRTLVNPWADILNRADLGIGILGYLNWRWRFNK